MDQRTKSTNNKRFVRYPEGAEMYSMSVSKFMQLAKDAKACYKVNQLVLVNLPEQHIHCRKTLQSCPNLFSAKPYRLLQIWQKRPSG